MSRRSPSRVPKSSGFLSMNHPWDMDRTYVRLLGTPPPPKLYRRRNDLHNPASRGIVSAMKWLSVAEAAERLGVSVRRVRQLVEQGDLPASRIGRAWAIDSAAVDRRKEREAPSGRPYSPRSAWRMAELADAIVRDHKGNLLLVELKHVPRGQQAEQRWRAIRSLRNLLSHGDSDVVAAMLRSRSRRVEPRYVHPSLLRKLSDDHRLVISGARAAENLGDLAADERLEAYIKSSDLLVIQDEYGLQQPADPARANVTLRVVEDDLAWSARQAPLLLIAADLRERDDARAREASDELFRRLHRALESVK